MSDESTTQVAEPAAPMVELRPLVGYFRDQAGRKFRVRHPVDQVLLKGRQVGMRAHAKGTAVCLLADVVLSDTQKQAIADEVTKKDGEPPRGFVSPLSSADIDGAAELVDEDDDDWDD